ncbi:MAG: tetraacyldisaccharide 4'-kinase [Bacteroidales bacterium]
MNYFKILLFPFAIIYGIVVFIRNKLFDWGLLKSVKFKVPVIGVGNLSAGGTGKTPHVEYLIELLSQDYKVAILSRGYKRTTKGFLIVNQNSTSKEVGDEPLQVFHNYPDVTVAVDEKRVRGINKLLKTDPGIQVIILDDSFQHRYVKPQVNVLITEYFKMFYNNLLLPCGTLREPKSQAKRADVMIVSKTPEVFSPLDRRLILKKLKRYKVKNIFFSYIKYKSWVPFTEAAKKKTKSEAKTIFLLTGIANPSALEEQLKRQSEELYCYHYPDHFNFTTNTLLKLKENFNNKFSGSKVIITTQKDAMRLQRPDLIEIIDDLPVYTLPMQIEFHQKDKSGFDTFIKKSIKK